MNKEFDYKEYVTKLFPNIKEEDIEVFLHETTAYPFGNTEHNCELLEELRKTLDGGYKPCDSCNKPRMENKYLCEDCIKVTTFE